MTKSYCLTVEVKSDHIENGLGYMVAFSIPKNAASPAELGSFGLWQEDVKKIVLRAGDQCLHSDPYTKKLAIAEMMHDLTDLNRRYDIQIGFLPRTPAIQIHSTNPFDNTVEIDFTDRQGGYTVTERGISDLKNMSIGTHGKTGLTEVTRKHFPFKKKTKSPPAAKKKPPQPKI